MPNFSGSVIAQPSTDQWQTLTCPGAARLTLTIAPPSKAATGGILYQLGYGAQAQTFEGVEQPLPPGIHTRERRVDAIRFKSLTPGKPAVVSIETATPEQVNGV